MKPLHHLALAHYRTLMTLVLAALAMQALVPAGVMVTPARGHGAQIILCPQTHPLARAAAAKATAKASAEMAAIHAAMGHAPMDHAKMGQTPESQDETAPGSSAASSGQSCAFAGAGALAGFLPEHAADFAQQTLDRALAPMPMQALSLARPPRLRPPLRGPPALI